MNIDMPLDVEVSLLASSTYTLQNIDDRLTELAGKTDFESVQEISYLQQLRAREWPA